MPTAEQIIHAARACAKRYDLDYQLSEGHVEIMVALAKRDVMDDFATALEKVVREGL